MTPISVVIPTYDRPQLLDQTLHKLGEQSLLPNEVVIIDNGINACELDPTAYAFPLRLYRICAKSGVSQARNIGVALAEGPYVAFLDDDDSWESNYLEKLQQHLPEDGQWPAMVVARVDHLRGNQRTFFRYAGNDPTWESCFYFNPGYLGSALSVEKNRFLQMGGFDARLQTSEDKELAIRYISQGLPVHYDDSLVAINFVHENSISSKIDYVGDAKYLLAKHRHLITSRIRLKAMREAYKKSAKKRYFLHKLILKLWITLSRAG